MASKRHWMKAALALVLFAVMLPGRVVVAQERPETDPKAEKAVDKALNQTEKEKGKQEEKEGGAADAIRHSPSIHWIASHTGMTDDLVYWVCIGLNFAVIFVGIGWLMRKNLPGYFQGRTSLIQKGIEEARKASEEARQRLNDVEGRLSRLDSEIAAIQREAEENAKAEEQRIQAAGEEERRRIVASAEQEIEMTANAARRELKSYVSELAIELAEKKIRVSKDTDEALVRAFTTQMGKDGN
jgi:F-type H+-transporting ATPase subunit b